jgi:hypothetical protein
MPDKTIVKYDELAGAWSDGYNFVKGSRIRKSNPDRKRGRLSRDEIVKYWKENYDKEVEVNYV